MPDPFIKEQAKQNKAESFRAQEAQSLTKSVGTAGKPLVEPRQKEDKTFTTSTSSIDLSDDRDDAVTTTTTVATPTYNYTEPSQMSGFDKTFYKFSTGNNYNLLSPTQQKAIDFNYNQRSLFDKIFNPISSRQVPDQVKDILLDPKILDYQTELKNLGYDQRDVLAALANDSVFSESFDQVENERAIVRRDNSENSIRNSYYDLFVNNPIYNFSPQTAEALTNIVDFTPIVGDVAGFEDAIINYKSGRYGAAAFDATLATIGLAPVAGDAIRKAINGIDIKDIAPQMFSTRPLNIGGRGGEFAKVTAINDWQKFLENQNLIDTFANKDIIEVLPTLSTEQKQLVMRKVDELYVKTGWNPGIKNKFVTEIDDSDAVLLNPERLFKFVDDPTKEGIIAGVGSDAVYLKDLLYHPKLFEVYPELENLTVGWSKKDINNLGTYINPKDSNTPFGEITLNMNRYKLLENNEELFSTLLHEIQHAIQYDAYKKIGGDLLATKSFTKGYLYEFEGILEERIELNKDLLKSKSSSLTNKEKERLENVILLDSFKLDSFRSKLEYNPYRIDPTTGKSYNTRAEFETSYGGNIIEGEARNTQERRLMDMEKRFSKSPFRTMSNPMQVSGYSGFDILMQLTKNADGTINYKAYNKTKKIIFDKLKSGVDKKFPNISPTKKQSILEENFYNILYENKSSAKDFAFKSEIPEVNDLSRQLFTQLKKQVEKAKGKNFSNQEFVTFYNDLFTQKDLNIDKGEVLSDTVNINVSPEDKTFFDNFYSPNDSILKQIDKSESVDPIPSISDPAKNISTNPASPLEIGVNKFNVDNIENPMLIKNYTKSNLIETEEFVKNSNKSTAGGGAKDLKINVPVEEGSNVAVRLNLSSRIDNTIKEIKDKPNLSNRLQTIHPVKNGVPDYKRSQSYMPYVTVENGKFDVNQNNRSKIVKTGDKNPAASVLGKYTTSRNIFDEMDDTVVEIGINPKMLHLFVNLKTGQAVKDFELATIFRDRVYAKGVTYWKKVEAPEPTQGTSSEVRYANKKGGLVW